MEAEKLKHTPELLRLEQNDRFDARHGYRLVSENAYQDRRDQKTSARPDYVGVIHKLEDAVWIVFCVNALAGISDPKEFVEAAGEMLEALHKLHGASQNAASIAWPAITRAEKALGVK